MQIYNKALIRIVFQSNKVNFFIIDILFVLSQFN